MTMTCISTALNICQLNKPNPGITNQPVVNIRATALCKVEFRSNHASLVSLRGTHKPERARIHTHSDAHSPDTRGNC
jgi:hypothetical protein